jgi:hypothetical protein
MAESLAFAQYLTLKSATGTVRYNFQNYWVNEDALGKDGSTVYGFMPFAFSGITVTKTGDNQPATLGFPNNSLSRGWGETAVQEVWIAQVQTVLVNPDSKPDYTVLSEYVGQIVNSTWDESSLQLNMASVLDAVGADIPRKRLTRQLVGNLPLTSRIRLT